MQILRFYVVGQRMMLICLPKYVLIHGCLFQSSAAPRQLFETPEYMYKPCFMCEVTCINSVQFRSNA